MKKPIRNYAPGTKTASCAIALIAAMTTTAANAQFVPTLPSTSFVYSANFICGTAESTRDEQSTGDAAFSPYDDLEPGSYASFATLTNKGTSQRNVTVYVSAQGLPRILNIESLQLGAFEARRFGCLNFMDEVSANWPTVLFGQAIQGTLFFVQFNDDIELNETQTFSAARNDGGNGGGVSVDVTPRPPREVDGVVIVPFLGL